MLDKKVIRKSLIIILIVLLILIGIHFIRLVFSRYQSEAQSSSKTDIALWIVNEGFISEELSIGEIRPIPGKSVTSLDSKIWNLINGTLSLEDFLGESASSGTLDDYIKTIDFSVQNYNDGDNPLVASVPLKYEIHLTTTTFMPLEYRLYQYKDDGSTIKELPCDVTNTIIEDESGTTYKKIVAKPSESNGNDFYLDNLEIGNHKEKDQFMLVVWMPDQNNDMITSNDQNYLLADLVEFLQIEIKAEQKLGSDFVENNI